MSDKNLDLPNILSWEDLGHDDCSPVQAFGPDYTEDDIGENYDLTVTVLGYQLGEEETKKLVDELKKHLFVCSVHKFTRKERLH